MDRMTNEKLQFNNLYDGINIDEYIEDNNVTLNEDIIEDDCCTNFIVFNEPNDEYIDSTTKINISKLTNYNYYSYITDGYQKVNFSYSLQKLTVPDSWATWGNPPYTESSTPAVLATNGNRSLTITLDKASCIFGFELEPNPFGTYNYIVNFYSGNTLVGTIKKAITGFKGARLLAASTDPGLLFDKIVIIGGADFAIAQIRYSTVSCKCSGDEPFLATFDNCQDLLTLPTSASLRCDGRLLIVDVTVTACEKRKVAVGILICDNQSNVLRFKVSEQCMPASTCKDKHCVENTFRFSFIFESEICKPLSFLVKTFAQYASFDFTCPY